MKFTDEQVEERAREIASRCRRPQMEDLAVLARWTLEREAGIEAKWREVLRRRGKSRMPSEARLAEVARRAAAHAAYAVYDGVEALPAIDTAVAHALKGGDDA